MAYPGEPANPNVHVWSSRVPGKLAYEFVVVVTEPEDRALRKLQVFDWVERRFTESDEGTVLFVNQRLQLTDTELRELPGVTTVAEAEEYLRRTVVLAWEAHKLSRKAHERLGKLPSLRHLAAFT